MEAEASRLIRSLREEQDAEGVRAFLGALDGETGEGLLLLFRSLVSASVRPSIAPEDLLAVLLCSRRTSHRAIDICCQLISSGELQCRQALLCVSEIRQSLADEVSRHSTRLALQEAPDVPGPSERASLRGLLTRAMDLITGADSKELSLPGGSGRLNQLVLILDILTPLLILARHLDDEEGYMDEDDDEDEAGQGGLAKQTIGRLLADPWPPALTLQLLSACQDLGPLMDEEDWALARSRVQENVRQCHPSDLPGLSRQCLALAESSGEEGEGDGQQQAAWIHLLREVLRCLPYAAAGTTELVMEQSVKQSLTCVEAVVREIDACLRATTGGEEEAMEEEEPGATPPLTWHDGNLLLLLMRAATAWPLQAVVEARHEGTGKPLASPRQLASLLLALVCHLAETDDALDPSPLAGASASSSSSSSSAQPTKAAAGQSALRLLHVERMSLVLVKMLTHDRAPRLVLGRVVMQRGSQLFHLAMQWMQDAEVLCQDCRRRHGRSLRAEELRQLAVLVMSHIYGELPEAQPSTLSTLLTAIVGQSGGDGDAAAVGGGGASRRALLGYVHALEAITTRWSSTLRQHTQNFQQLVLTLPTLPARLAATLLEAVTPLACTCPAFLDGLLAGIRKGVAQSDVNSRTFATMTLMALLTQHSGLLSLADRCQEVSSVFDSLLTLSLPLHLKSRLYRAVSRTRPLRSAPSAPHLRDTLGRRLDRFFRRDAQHRGAPVLDPLSLYHEYTSAQGSVRVTAKDDLPELLRAFLALSAQQEEEGVIGAFIAQQVLCGQGGAAAAVEASSSSSSPHLAVRAILRFLRHGCPVEEEGRQSHSSSSSSTCEHVPVSEKLDLFSPLTEALLDALLDYPEALDHDPTSSPRDEEQADWPHAAVLASCHQLYAVHGMLTDVAEALGLRARDRWPQLVDGAERDGPCLSLRSAVYLLQLVILEGRGHLQRQKRPAVCGDCGRLQARYRWWALHHALLACRAGLEAQCSGGRWADPEAQKSQSFSLKALLVLLMDLHDLCATTTPTDDHDDGEQQEEEPAGGWACGHGAAAAASAADRGASNGKARLRQSVGGGQSRPLWSDFLSNVDPKFSDLVRAVAGGRGAQSEAVLLVRANIVQCIRVTLRLCPPDTLEGDEIFAFFEPPPPPLPPAPPQQQAGGAAAAAKSLPPLLQYKGLPYLVNSMVTELSASLGHKGLPLRLVQSYLDLFDVLFTRIAPPPPTHHDGQDHDDDDDDRRRYEEWRAGVADGLAHILLRTTISQSTVVRHFLRLAMTVGPRLQSLHMSCGLARVVIGYLQDWVKEKHADVEVITASEARRQFIEEGDEFFRDDDSDEDDEEDDDDEEQEKDGGGGQRAEEAAGAALSELRFASEACWQAAAGGLLKVWEGLLSSALLDGDHHRADSAADEAAAWLDLMRQLARFFMVVEGGGRRARGKMAACMLPATLKSRLAAVLARLYATVRLAATRVASHVRSQGPLEETVEEVAEVAGQGGGPHVRSSLCLAVCYHEEGEALEGLVRAWVKAERGGRRQRDAGGLLKRFPALLFAVERVHMSMHRLTQQVSRMKKLDSAPALWRRLAVKAKPSGGSSRTAEEEEEVQGGKEQDEEEEEEPMPVIGRSRGKKRKRRLRSRNLVVDRWLEEEDGSDAYADLEDFIAPNEIT